MHIETRECKDGSMTLYLPDMDETYHSMHGAITESQYVYIQEGLALIDANEVSILEFGFGTGLNALLSLKHAISNKQTLAYYTVEKFPLDAVQLDTLNYAKELGALDEWTHLHALKWNTWQDWETQHRCYKWQGDFKELDLPLNSIDLIYYDAFAPSKQNEVWSIDYLSKAAEVLKPEGILVTYCAQGQFRRNLESLGFEVSRLPGPPGKKEMIRAQLK